MLHDFGGNTFLFGSLVNVTNVRRRGPSIDSSPSRLGSPTSANLLRWTDDRCGNHYGRNQSERNHVRIRSGTILASTVEWHWIRRLVEISLSDRSSAKVSPFQASRIRCETVRDWWREYPWCFVSRLGKVGQFGLSRESQWRRNDHLGQTGLELWSRSQWFFKMIRLKFVVRKNRSITTFNPYSMLGCCFSMARINTIPISFVTISSISPKKHCNINSSTSTTNSCRHSIGVISMVLGRSTFYFFFWVSFFLSSTQSALLIDILADTELILASDRRFLLGNWIADALQFAQSEGETHFYNFNAKLQVSIWGNNYTLALYDYANKFWSGMMEQCVSIDPADTRKNSEFHLVITCPGGKSSSMLF